MTHASASNRPDKLRDLTRWNRAGLGRFDYIDGDAAVWLEELRLVLAGLYMRGADADLRVPERWRDVFTKPADAWPDAAVLSEVIDAVIWERLAPQAPPTRELRGQRNRRLLSQYNGARGDMSWEILRAFARASHVLLGHTNAYANEGYIRTATQWDNLRRLAAMVNHQPTPPASATSIVALEIKPDFDATEIARGLAMKYARPEGGKPLVFETLSALDAHPDLNAARVVDWDKNLTPMSFAGGGPVDWLADDKVDISAGGLAVLSGPSGLRALGMNVVDCDSEPGVARITFDASPDVVPTHWDARLHAAPSDVLSAQAREGEGEVIVELEDPARYAVGQVVQVYAGEATSLEIITAVEPGAIRFASDDSLSGAVEIEPLAKFAGSRIEGFVAPDSVSTMYFVNGDQIFTSSETLASTGIGELADLHGKARADREGYVSFITDSSGSHVFRPMGFNTDTGFASVDGTDRSAGKIARRSRAVTAGSETAPTHIVSFLGKPPKGLAAGDIFVARSADDGLSALQVVGVRSSAGSYQIEFDQSVSGDLTTYEFHGPMTVALHAAGYDANPDPALTTKTITLEGISSAARALLKPGRAAILSRIEDDQPVADVPASVAAVDAGTADDTALVTFDYTEPTTGWAKSELVVRLNCVEISHGETKDAKLLGSGDGERTGQTFTLSVNGVAHIPSTASASGVAPDMDVTVDGIAWAHADYIDPLAEGTKSWSSVLTDDGALNIVFRRRLPTGTNNVSVKRYRIGSGAKGSGVPPYAFKKPMKKSPYVSAIYQPFETSGGADRESVSSLRESTPSKLAANGRAVSIADFERLIASHASVWRARAEEVATASAQRRVNVVLVPAGEAELTDTLKQNLRDTTLARAIPGVRLSFEAFEPLHLNISATVRTDTASFDKSELAASCITALSDHFSLEKMDFAQAVYRSEILAVLETVEGVETAIVTGFDIYPTHTDTTEGIPRPKNVTLRDSAVSAIFPKENQVLFVPSADSGTTYVPVSIIAEAL